jgi:hypothetical protein
MNADETKKKTKAMQRYAAASWVLLLLLRPSVFASRHAATVIQ